MPFHLLATAVLLNIYWHTSSCGAKIDPFRPFTATLTSASTVCCISMPCTSFLPYKRFQMLQIPVSWPSLAPSLSRCVAEPDWALFHSGSRVPPTAKRKKRKHIMRLFHVGSYLFSRKYCQTFSKTSLAQRFFLCCKVQKSVRFFAWSQNTFNLLRFGNLCVLEVCSNVRLFHLKP